MRRSVLLPGGLPAAIVAALVSSATVFSACDTAAPVYSHALLTEYVQEAMPFANAQGQPWDATSGPDVVFLLLDEHDREVARSRTYPDLTPADLPIHWSFLPRPALTDFDASYRIALYDGDEDGLEAMATTAPFTLQEFAAAGFATTYTFENVRDTLSSRVEIHWEE